MISPKSYDDFSKRKQFLLLGFITINIYFVLKYFNISTYPEVIASLIFALAINYGKLRECICKGWLTIIYIINFLISEIVLFLTYFLVVTPTGIIRKLLSNEENIESTWIVRKERNTNFNKQY